jgi:hypothetical protein
MIKNICFFNIIFQHSAALRDFTEKNTNKMFMNRLSCSNFTIFTLLVVTYTLHVSASQSHHQVRLFIETCHTALVIGNLYGCTSKTYFLLLLHVTRTTDSGTHREYTKQHTETET